MFTEQLIFMSTVALRRSTCNNANISNLNSLKNNDANDRVKEKRLHSVNRRTSDSVRENTIGSNKCDKDEGNISIN